MLHASVPTSVTPADASANAALVDKKASPSPLDVYKRQDYGRHVGILGYDDFRRGAWIT